MKLRIPLPKQVEQTFKDKKKYTRKKKHKKEEIPKKGE
jgi:hypothetical protein